jgi:hypothetical protein
MTNAPEARQSELVVQEFESETLIYDLRIDKAFCLNESLTTVWRLCSGTNSVAEITDLLNRKMKTPVTDDFVWLALEQLKNHDLLKNSEQLEIDFNGLSRRQIIKKVGLASMIALPVVASVIAPNAAMAASGCVNPGGLAPGTFLGGAGGVGFCSDPNAANLTCTSVRGNSCCSGRAVDNGTCRDAGPGPNFGTYSVACTCS